MSLAFGGAYQLTSNSTQEIQENNTFKKARLEDGQVKLTKRAALGTITNNVGVRVQPFRAAKAGNGSGAAGLKNDENAFSRAAKSAFSIPTTAQQGFAIHIDQHPKISASQKATSLAQHVQESVLNPALSSLSRPALTNVFVAASRDSSEVDSPMIIDSDFSSEDEVDIDSSSPCSRGQIHNIDSSVVDPILDVPEYASEIFKYLKQAELQHRPKPGYMRKQPDINNSMRAILVDWLVEVGEEYKLLPQTLYLTVNYIDRFLSAMSVLRGKLQLVGTACMLLASKFEEIYPPEVSEFVYITDDTYSSKQVLKMEQLVLKVLTFDLSIPTILNFLERFLKAGTVTETSSPKVEALARYLCEISLLDSEPFLTYLPSTIAASAVVLSLHTLGLPYWNNTLSHYTGFELHDLQACIQDLHRCFAHAPKHPQQATREKYRSMKFYNVSSLSPPESLPMA